MIAEERDSARLQNREFFTPNERENVIFWSRGWAGVLIALLKDMFSNSGILSCDTNLLGRVSALSPPFVAACGVPQRSRVADLDVKGVPSSVLGGQSFVSDLGYVDGSSFLPVSRRVSNLGSQ